MTVLVMLWVIATAMTWSMSLVHRWAGVASGIVLAMPLAWVTAAKLLV